MPVHRGRARPRTARTPLSAVVLAALVVAGLAGMPERASALEVTVGSPADFAAALAEANLSPEPDVIVIDVPSDETWDALPTFVVVGDLTIERAAGSGRVTFSSVQSAFALALGAAFHATGIGVTGRNRDGIEAPSGADVVLTDVILSGSAGSGLNLVGGTLTATRVTAADNGAAGILAVDVSAVTLDGGDLSRNLVGLSVGTRGGTVSISGTTVTDNGRPFRPDGGGIVVDADAAATVDLTGVTVSGNRGSLGAGMRIDRLAGGSQLTIAGSDFLGNVALAGGGAIASAEVLSPAAITGGSTLRIEDSTIAGNSAADSGGGFAFPTIDPGATVEVVGSAITGNSAFFGGGGVVGFLPESAEPSFVLDSSTVSGNSATQAVGGLLLQCDELPGTARAAIVNSTFSGNSGDFGAALSVSCDDAAGFEVDVSHTTVTAQVAGDSAVDLYRSTVTMRHTIVGGNATALDVALEDGALDVAYALVGTAAPDAGTALAAGVGNLVGVTPDLEPLAANGGRAPTHLPVPGGNVVDAGDPAFAPPPALDQRGEARVVDVVDLGSVELALAVPPTTPTPGGDAVLPPTGDPRPAVAAAAALLLLLAGAVLTLRRRGVPRAAPLSPL